MDAEKKRLLLVNGTHGVARQRQPPSPSRSRRQSPKLNGTRRPPGRAPQNGQAGHARCPLSGRFPFPREDATGGFPIISGFHLPMLGLKQPAGMAAWRWRGGRTDVDTDTMASNHSFCRARASGETTRAWQWPPAPPPYTGRQEELS
jgi:hypothetical protein